MSMINGSWKSSLTRFFPSSSCTHATSSSCCLRHGNCCGCCQISTASPLATAKKSLFAVSCRKSSEMQGCAVDFTLPKKFLQTCMAPKFSRFGRSFSAMGVLSSRVTWEWSDNRCCVYILKDRINCWLELSALQEIYTGSWKICCWFSTRSETHSLDFICFNIKSQAKEGNNKPK